MGTTVVLNGLGYSLHRFFEPTIIVSNQYFYNKKRIDNIIGTLSQFKEPITLIGFSAGANAAFEIAAELPIDHLVIHSTNNPLPREPLQSRRVQMFSTRGDRTGCAKATKMAHEYLIKTTEATHEWIELPFKPFVQATLFEQLVLTPLKHQFHNCLPYL